MTGPAFRLAIWLLLVGGLGLLGPARLEAAPRLDAFPGYSSSGYARLGTHYPLAIELQGDGPSLKGFLEISQGQFGGQPIRVPIELPSGTTKRVVIPLFASSANFAGMDVRLLNENGKVVAERLGAGLTTFAPESVIMGTLPGQAQSAPGFPEANANRNTADVRPLAARLDPGLFPDTALALEGLNSLYLNSRRALELKEPQIAALQTWVASGGHVMVAIESATDVTATRWLSELLPARVAGGRNVAASGVFQRFIGARTGPGFGALQYGRQPIGLHGSSGNDSGESPYDKVLVDSDFERQNLPTVGLTPAPEAEVFLAAGTTPLGVSGRYGRGLVTALTFNPELEPFRTWKNRPWLFARLASVPSQLLGSDRQQMWGGRGIDTVFGAMIETRQIRKLPVGILLLLLLVYLAVIGPFDQWWLRKINRPMLTWITFPAYVALFSLLIYFIGFKLRSGQSEYSELQVVDILPRGASADAALRGRSFASLYSPANNNYALKSDLPVATLRGEMRSSFGLQNDAGRLDLQLNLQGFQASAYVPVWTAQGYVGDWATDAEAALTGQWNAGRLTLKSSGAKFARVWVSHAGELRDMGPLGANGELNFTGGGGDKLERLIAEWNTTFSVVAQGREQTFGDSAKQQINATNWPTAVMAASFCAKLNANDGNNQREWMWPNGFDLTPNERRGDTIVFAWQGDDTAVPRLNQFSVLRGTKAVMYRLVIPKTSAESP